MSTNRRNLENPSTARAIAPWITRFTVRDWLLLLVVLCQFATILITWNVWHVRDQPMNLPLFRFLTPIAELPELDAIGPILLLSLVLVLVRPRVGVVVHAAIYFAACLLDQYRLQPQLLSLIVLMFACAFDVGWWFARWYLVSLWFWTGAHKLLSVEWLGVQSHAFLASCGIQADGWSLYFAIFVGAMEILLGLLAVFAPRKAIPLCLGIHLGILLLLSPLAANHNESVWPWNLATAIVGTWILLQVSIQPAPQNRVRYAIVAVLLLVPAGFYVDWVNSRLCFVLYSGNMPRALHVSTDQARRLDGWTGLTVPFPNSARLLVQVFDRSSESGDKLYVLDPRRLVPDRYFLKANDGSVQEITRDRFYRSDPASGEVGGVEFASANAVWHLKRAGALLVKDESQMVSSATLQGTSFGDREFQYLRQLPNLLELKVESTAVTDAGIQSLAGLRRLRILQIQGGRLTDECLTVVRQWDLLGWLSLEDVPISSDGVAVLRNLPNLEVLHLPRSQIDDRALVHIGTLSKLNWLDLSDTNITDAGLPELAALGHLELLKLKGTEVTEQGVERLRSSLPNCRIDW